MSALTLTAYQDAAAKTAIYPRSAALPYLALGIASEAGEVAGKAKKVIRDEGGDVSPEKRGALLDEVGDVLWYAAMLADALGSDLGSVAEANLAKLADRAERGALMGSGDTR